MGLVVAVIVLRPDIDEADGQLLGEGALWRQPGGEGERGAARAEQ